MAEMLDVLSTLDAHDNPYLGNCTLVLGDFSLEFKNGRAKVPADMAGLALRHPKLMIPGYTGQVAPRPPNVAAPLPDVVGREQDASMVDIAADYLRSEGMEVLQEGPVEKEVAELEAHLSRDDAELPAGFEELTADGKPRCWAHKGDGSQCSNAASEGSHACGLAAHQKQ